MYALRVILYTSVVFLAMMINLAVRPKTGAKRTGVIIGIAAVMGFIFYGYGYAHTIPDVPMAVLRATMSVWFMFVGRNDLSAVSSAPLFQTKAGLFLFWMTHLLAIYAFASATFITIGSGAVRFLRTLRGGFRPIALIYGIGDASVAFARELAEKNKKLVILMVDDESLADSFGSDIRQFGGITCCELSARQAERSFFNSFHIGRGSRHYDLYALHESAFENIRYAQSFLNTAKERGVTPDQMRLVLAADEAMIGDRLLAGEDQYGFGEVFVFSAGDMAARLMLRSFPPAKTLAFDEQGRARQNFEALLIGFGQTAQSVLRQLIMQGQFEGSKMHITVCDRNLSEVAGNFLHREKALLEEYDIEFITHDARSDALYDYLEEHSGNLRYIVISTGDRRQNQEIALDLLQYLSGTGCEIPVIVCSNSGVSYADTQSMQWKTLCPVTVDILCNDKLDEMAMEVNQAYCDGNGKDAKENWKTCGYFSRMSCRAAADFLPAYLEALADSGISVDSTMPDDDSVIQTLGQTEHRRWCAFHRVMGYRVMPEKIYESRAAEYLKEKSEKGRSGIRIGRDAAKRLHACLIPWDGLDALSAKEAGITGKDPEYKKMDINNIRVIMRRGESQEKEQFVKGSGTAL
ncbi:MAG: hypothetical protein J5969_01950 [Lachnospiraceae bacterium]|nr:hypothetical protein [Lachnospiraceae bacterium]